MLNQLTINSNLLIPALFIFAIAVLYSTVGHAGASGYLATMALFGFDPEVMKSTALILNILVATIGTIRFHRAKQFSWNIFWPFALTSIPFSFIGGMVELPYKGYRELVALVLIVSAYRLFRTGTSLEQSTIKQCPVGLALLAGSIIGLLSGLVGVGGGIFLSPLLLLMGWATTRQTSAVAVVFILVNSVAGLTGHLKGMHVLPAGILLWVFAAALGGWIGSGYGSLHLATTTIRKLLATALIIASVKLCST